ncbi:hypothetical protein AB0I90_27295 [Micromonospora wenchangensis]|uniref:hypothetical protein n=1 Tax=Micromonospora wenchangensis TaxID=1185415 RepID=UPI003410E61D
MTSSSQPAASDLVTAQERDSEDNHWQQTRTLYRASQDWQDRMLTGRRGSARQVVEAVAGRLLEPGMHGVRQLLENARVERARTPPVLRVSPFLPPSVLPLRAALASDPDVAARIMAEPAWSRVVLVLYGGVPLPGTRRHETLRRRLTADFDDEAMGCSRRAQAAVALDLLTAGADGSDPGVDDARIDPAAIVADSPLTSRLLAWLRDGTDLAVVGGSLIELASDTDQDASLRGDALVAWALLGRQPTSWPQMVDDDAVTRRVRWRLGRALLVLGDAARPLSPGPVAGAFDALRLPGARQHALDSAVVRALTAVSGRRNAWTGLMDGHLPVALVEAVNGHSGDLTYNMAVYLDSAGAGLVEAQGQGLAALIATIAFRAGGAAGAGVRWPLDPFAPRAGHPLAETLTAVRPLHPSLAFLRCWIIDRLAGELTEAQFVAEAACLALQDLDLDPVSVTRTLNRLGFHPAGEGQPVSPSAVLRSIEYLAGRTVDAYARARVRLRLAQYTGQRIIAGRLLADAAEIVDVHDRVRMWELALDLGAADDTATVVTALTSLVPQLVSPTERALAAVRLARLTGEDILACAVAHLGQVPPEEAADLLSRLPAPLDDDQAAVRAAALDRLTAPQLRARADQRLAEPLLSVERDHRPPRGWAENPHTRLPLRWSIVSAAAVCVDGLRELDRSGSATTLHGDAAWLALLTPATRAAALAALTRRGTTELLALGPTAVAVLDRLLDGAEVDTVAAILSLSRSNPREPAVRRWRADAATEVADLATLITVEWGEVDAEAVAAAPRLFAHPDSMVRRRLAQATGPVHVGRRSRPWALAGAVGATAVAALARVLTAETCPAVAAGLQTMLRGIGHDSPSVLHDVLGELSGQPEARITVLRGLRRFRDFPVDALVALAASLAAGERWALLDALHVVAEDPRNRGVSPEWVRDLASVAVHLAADEDPTVAGSAMALLGRCAPGDAAVVAALCTEVDGADLTDRRAAGAATGLGHLLAGGGLGPDEQSRAVQVLSQRLNSALAEASPLAAGILAALVHAGADVASLPDDELAVRALVLAAGTTAFAAHQRWLPDAARLVTRHADRSLRLAGLLTDLATTAVDRTDPAVLAGTVPAPGSPDLVSALAALAALGQQAPDLVRQAIGDREGLTGRIRGGLTGGSADLAGQAVRLLVLLEPDAATMTGVLTAVAGSQLLEDGLADAVAALDRLPAGAVAALVTAATGPSPTVAVLAARLIRVLASRDLLAGETRMAIVDALGAPDPPTMAGSPHVFDVGLQDAGTVADVLGDTAVQLRDGSAVGPQIPVARLVVPLGGERALELVIPDQVTPQRVTVGRQMDALDGRVDTALAGGLSTVLDVVAASAHEQGVAVPEALEALLGSLRR